MTLLKALKVKPSIVFMFESSEEDSIRRMGDRRVDPQTGTVYNLKINPPSDEKISNRLIEMKEDHASVIKTKFT
jgi:hypothetical protein